MSFLMTARGTRFSGDGFGQYRLDAQRCQRCRTAPAHRDTAAAEDEVSAAIAALFSEHGAGFQALSAQAAAFHDQFVQTLSGGAGAYSLTEAANVTPLQQALIAINAPVQAATGRPLIGNGANWAPGTGQAGKPGGWIRGDGGSGGSGGPGQNGGAGGAAGLVGTGGVGGTGGTGATTGGAGGAGGLLWGGGGCRSAATSPPPCCTATARTAKRSPVSAGVSPTAASE